jgi:8-oxo-dGTP diphosphatase
MNNPRVGLGAIIYSRCGRVLIEQRGAAANNRPGQWDFPGGSLEYGELALAGIIREIREECGDCVASQITWKVTRPIVFEDLLLDEGQHWISLAFVGVIEAPTPPEIVTPSAERSKVMQADWYTFQDLANLQKGGNVAPVRHSAASTEPEKSFWH